MSAESTDVDETRNWPELFAKVYDEVSNGDGAAIRLQEMEIQVPSKTGEDADHAYWQVDGTIELNPED